MYDILHITAQYSNAVLVAVMPYVSDFAEKLDLPIIKPVTTNHVREFKCSWRSDIVGGGLTLTNGYDFSFMSGRVTLYRSSESYFSLQDPDRIPEFYGDVKISEPKAIEIARETIQKLGYSLAILHADKNPIVISPPKIEDRYSVPRYRIKWFEPNPRDPDMPHPTIEFEVDASDGRIHLMYLMSQKVLGPEIKVDVQPTVLRAGPRTTYVGGTKIIPVSQSYSNAFLEAILPLFNDYVVKTGFEVKLPITTNDVDMSRYVCGIINDDPNAFVFLKTGDRFHFRRGQVVSLLLHDVVHMPGEEPKPDENFYGRLNIPPEESIRLIRKVVSQLGYPLEKFGLHEAPQFYPPKNLGTNSYARYFFRWQEKKPESAGAVLLQAEVDATTGKLKSLNTDVRGFPELWRKPPQINVPAAAESESERGKPNPK